MLTWIFEVNSYQNKESNIHYLIWLRLANIGLDYSPRVTTVVFRGVTDSYELKILTDKKVKNISNYNLI
tara:strand:- start:31 stop:237 length:207 start_codon:yes stop_codon:yes gene_type:complete